MMTNATLFLFTGKCLAMDGNPSVREEVVAAISGGSVPWESFVWTGSSHFVLPALYSAFDRNGILPLLPEDLVTHMRHIYSLNAQRNERIIEQCLQISRLLHAADIRPVFFKGSALLLMGLFKDPGDRMMEDIDLLLPEAEIPPALDILLQGGYLQHPVDEGKEEVYTDHHHLPPMYHPGQVATLEIHRYPVHEEYRKLIREADVLREAVPTGDCFVASPRHAGVLVCLHEHRMGRGYLSSTGTLKGAFDFFLLSKLRPPEPEDLPEGKYRKKYLRYAWSVEKIMGGASDVPAAETSQYPVKAGAGAESGGSHPDGTHQLHLKARDKSGGPSGPARDFPGLKSRVLWCRKELFLLDHPGIDHFWHEYIYAPALFIKLLGSSIWSDTDRKLVRLKLRKVFN